MFTDSPCLISLIQSNHSKLWQSCDEVEIWGWCQPVETAEGCPPSYLAPSPINAATATELCHCVGQPEDGVVMVE